jgi:hypothetical protein
MKMPWPENEVLTSAVQFPLHGHTFYIVPSGEFASVECLSCQRTVYDATPNPRAAVVEHLTACGYVAEGEDNEG